jgi:hypothetical protein
MGGWSDRWVSSSRERMLWWRGGAGGVGARGMRRSGRVATANERGAGVTARCKKARLRSGTAVTPILHSPNNTTQHNNTETTHKGKPELAAPPARVRPKPHGESETQKTRTRRDGRRDARDDARPHERAPALARRRRDQAQPDGEQRARAAWGGDRVGRAGAPGVAPRRACLVAAAARSLAPSHLALTPKHTHTHTHRPSTSRPTGCARSTRA